MLLNYERRGNGEPLLLLPHLARYREELPAQTRWIELRGCGHVPMYDDPDQVVQTVLQGTGG